MLTRCKGFMVNEALYVQRLRTGCICVALSARGQHHPIYSLDSLTEIMQFRSVSVGCEAQHNRPLGGLQSRDLVELLPSLTYAISL